MGILNPSSSCFFAELVIFLAFPLLNPPEWDTYWKYALFCSWPLNQQLQLRMGS
jgi:hypothetical protein